MTPIYTLNLSDLEFGLVNLAPFSFGTDTPIVDLGDLPEGKPAVVYIVGHAVPDGLRDLNQALVREQDIAGQLIARDAPTLVIFDICFAETFERIPGVSWPDKIGRIYSCKAYERTWHNGEKTVPLRESLFSRELNTAICPCVVANSFFNLQSSLVAAFGGLQQPVVRVSSTLTPRLFSLM